MTTASELIQYKGQTRILKSTEGKGLQFEVEVLEVRQVWNRIDLLVKPVSGKGEEWVSLGRTEDLAVNK